MSNQLKIRIWNAKDLPKNWYERGKELDETVENDVKAIMTEVKNNGDAALVKFTKEFDKADLKSGCLRVTPDEIKEAYTKVTDEQTSALKVMKDRLSDFEKPILNQLGTAISREGITIQTLLFPIDSVGCYVPGGQAAYPSTVIMTTVPAKAAGVPRVVVVSPPDKDGRVNPLVLVAADICGVNEIYKVGGAQAIAALAYGTNTIPPVRKIIGPGNKYVTMAKILISKDIAIDMAAGPSEVLVLADETADPELVTVDMISQSEHGTDSVAGLITTSERLAEEVANLLESMSNSIARKEIVRKALKKHAFIIVCDTMDKMIRLANIFASEHVEILTKNPLDMIDQITSAGSILVGPYSPVALSDYGSGTNHVLPTGGFAHSFSGLSILDFVRRVSVVDSSKEGLLSLKNHIRVLTEAERLPNHYKSVEARFKDEN